MIAVGPEFLPEVRVFEERIEVAKIPKDAIIDWRCPKCKRLLFKARFLAADEVVEIKCPKCTQRGAQALVRFVTVG